MVTVYTKPDCPECEKTKSHLRRKDIPFEIIDMFADRSVLQKIKDMGFRSAPVVMTSEGDSWSGYKPEKISALAASSTSDDDTWSF